MQSADRFAFDTDDIDIAALNRMLEASRPVRRATVHAGPAVICVPVHDVDSRSPTTHSTALAFSQASCACQGFEMPAASRGGVWMNACEHIATLLV